MANRRIVGSKQNILPVGMRTPSVAPGVAPCTGHRKTYSQRPGFQAPKYRRALTRDDVRTAELTALLYGIFPF